MLCVLTSVMTTVLALRSYTFLPPFTFYNCNLNIQPYLQEILNNAQCLKQVSWLVLNKPYKISDKIVKIGPRVGLLIFIQLGSTKFKDTHLLLTSTCYFVALKNFFFL